MLYICKQISLNMYTTEYIAQLVWQGLINSQMIYRTSGDRPMNVESFKHQRSYLISLSYLTLSSPAVYTCTIYIQWVCEFLYSLNFRAFLHLISRHAVLAPADCLYAKNALKLKQIQKFTNILTECAYIHLCWKG